MGCPVLVSRRPRNSVLICCRMDDTEAPVTGRGRHPCETANWLRFPWGPGQRWTCFATQELNETFARPCGGTLLMVGPSGKGESLNQFDPHGAEARICPTTPEVWQKVENLVQGVVHLLHGAHDQRIGVKRFSKSWVGPGSAFGTCQDRLTQGPLSPASCRPRVFLTNTVPYLTFMNGDERVQAACLGIMNSLLFDWQARRFAEIHMNFFILEALTVPDLSDNDFEGIAHAAALFPLLTTDSETLLLPPCGGGPLSGMHAGGLGSRSTPESPMPGKLPRPIWQSCSTTSPPTPYRWRTARRFWNASQS